MHFIIETPIPKDFKNTFSKFDKKLFESLKPPLMSLKVDRFDGCKKGDEVHLRINGQVWVSHITDFFESDTEIYFIDVGIVIPFPIKTWKHTHLVKKVDENNCLVIDDIEFSTGNYLVDRLMHPILYAMFSLRGPIYKRELA
ncbi:MAG: hypothetical protein K2Q18_14445 [Bdellovibrionales bacterium]|nr:hypothetical protein [Bdellovibrionales bacterium]